MLGGKALLQDKKTGTVTAKQAGPTTPLPHIANLRKAQNKSRSKKLGRAPEQRLTNHTGNNPISSTLNWKPLGF